MTAVVAPIDHKKARKPVRPPRAGPKGRCVRSLRQCRRPRRDPRKFALLVRCARAPPTRSATRMVMRKQRVVLPAHSSNPATGEFEPRPSISPGDVIHDDLAHGLPTARHNVPRTQIARWPEVLRGLARSGSQRLGDANGCVEARKSCRYRFDMRNNHWVRSLRRSPREHQVSPSDRSGRSPSRVRPKPFAHPRRLFANSQSPARIAALSRNCLLSRT
jgi:hypothetical protein